MTDPSRFLNNGQPSFVAKLIDALELRASESVAHVGAGTGYFTAVIAATLGPSGRVTAIELDQELATFGGAQIGADGHAQQLAKELD